MSPVPLVPKEPKQERLFRRTTNWLVVVATAIFSAQFFVFVAYNLWADSPNNWIIETVKQHFAATIGLPLAAIAALCLVFLLKFSSGPIEFEGLGFKLRGASGPLVLWVICFLAISGAIKLLW